MPALLAISRIFTRLKGLVANSISAASIIIFRRALFSLSFSAESVLLFFVRKRGVPFRLQVRKIRSVWYFSKYSIESGLLCVKEILPGGGVLKLELSEKEMNSINFYGDNESSGPKGIGIAQEWNGLNLPRRRCC